MSETTTGGTGKQFHFDPDAYSELMRSEVRAYARMQNEVADATNDIVVHRFLDLGVGTGTTTELVSLRHPDAEIVGIDQSAKMLEHARQALPQADFRVQRLQEELPEGHFDLVISALAVHHLDGPAKADLFIRVAAVLAPRGRFVLGDVVVPQDSADIVTPINGEYDRPSRVDEQLKWLRSAGFSARTQWIEHDVAVLVADARMPAWPDRP